MKAKPTTFEMDDATNLLDKFKDAFSKVKRMQERAPELVTLGLQHVSRLERAKLRSMQLGRSALVARMGKDDLRVRELDTRIAAHEEVGAALESLHARATAAAPKTPGGQSALFGRVVDSDGSPVRGVSVVLLRSGKKAGEDGTDAKGRFAIRLMDFVDSIVRAMPNRVDTAPVAGDDAAAGHAGAEENEDQLRAESMDLQVRDAAGRVRYKHPSPIELRGGRATYLEINLEVERARSPQAARGAAAAKDERIQFDLTKVAETAKAGSAPRTKPPTRPPSRKK